MRRHPANYNTKQSEAVLACLAKHKDEYITAAQIGEHFQKSGDPVSRTTIYRQLERLVQEGRARKYTFDGTQGACFRYAEQPENEQDFYHLKCEGCGGIFHLKCDEVDHVSRHIFETHAFQVNDSKTVFYGKCNMCLPK
ncbi:MAG: transcriptional repressor [Oscillospiraceae bacterium]|nr:transcriptional repressor [Oscillospiraceae bacterium]